MGPSFIRLRYKQLHTLHYLIVFVLAHLYFASYLHFYTHVSSLADGRVLKVVFATDIINRISRSLPIFPVVAEEIQVSL